MPESSYWQKLHWERMDSSRYDEFDEDVEILCIEIVCRALEPDDEGVDDPAKVHEVVQLLRTYQSDLDAFRSEPREHHYPHIPEPWGSWFKAVRTICYANFLWTAPEEYQARIISALLISVMKGTFVLHGGELELAVALEPDSTMTSLLSEAQGLYPNPDDLWGSREWGKLGWSFENEILYGPDSLAPLRCLRVSSGLENPRWGRIIGESIDDASGTSSSWESSFSDAILKHIEKQRLELDEDDPRHLPWSEDSFSALLLSNGSGISVDPAVHDLIDEVSGDANAFFAELMEAPPRLHCSLRPIYEWGSSTPFLWRAHAPDRETVEEFIEFENLSSAERRWARFAIQLATPSTNVSVAMIAIDEPERGLHRRAEKRLAGALSRIAHWYGATLVVATHSPSFLSLPDARLHHLRKRDDGLSELEALPVELYEEIDNLGVDRTDLLQMCRLFLIVEGEHDLIVLSELIGSDLSELGVIILPLRGLRNLSNSSDAQIIFKYTDAAVMFLSDNERHTELQEMWESARSAAPGDVSSIVDAFGRDRKNAEAQMLKEFAVLASQFEARSRISLAALSAPDILDYLPVSSFVEGATSWASLRREWETSGLKQQFKPWLTATKGAELSNERIRRAAHSMDHLPNDIVELLNAISGVLTKGNSR
ncbi:MAG: AAA family ATPase [Actinomycetota bacterium]|nr:AAA family ATPase [Actinomycetota bacterium]